MTDEISGFVFNQTMLRVKNPAVSVDFYQRVLGFTQIHRVDFEAMRFSLYFLAMLPPGERPPEDETARRAFTFSREALLELTHNWGSEDDDSVTYHDGNSEPRGFGHIGISVPDVRAVRAAWRAVREAPGRRHDPGHRLHQGPGRLLDRDPCKGWQLHDGGRMMVGTR